MGVHIMAVAEIAAGITSLRATMDIAKAMIGLRDAETFRTKSIELQETILRALDSGIEAREAYAQQSNTVRSLEDEVARLKDWDSEKERYELKSIGTGAVAYVLKPAERGSEPPHWLCPNCFHQGRKSFFQSAMKMELRRLLFDCVTCRSRIAVSQDVTKWPD
jgi:hypothetical protein